MTKEILLHVGSPKCGSTYMQNVMLNNAALLEAAGVRYPHDGGTHPGNAADIKSITPARLDSYFAGGMQRVILSHEDLFSLVQHGDTLAALTAERGIAVQLLFFLRPFSEFVYGDYSQFMKQFFQRFLDTRNPYDGRDFKTFAQRRIDTMTPHLYLRRWQRRFPARPVIVASHRALRPTLAGWLGEALAERMDWDLPPGKVNKSLRMQDCDALAAAMRDPSVTQSEILAMRKEAFENLREPDAGRTPERTAWLEAQFAPHNKALLDEFGFDNRHPDHGGPS
ncbi:histidine phosphatase family protein (plasmid) [Roseovarius faecimaris]|uniref:Histidine phosphatase family protein n=1 Tax=Roseovarius faecimaris TaxID=2494550 RepID=A0A6I6IKF4_9RHOB|nr:hypothetical protein [Roseovarius faecimaris]QGX96772.1 histidine phosphatase family protein [Roseovarius faecimaris]